MRIRAVGVGVIAAAATSTMTMMLTPGIAAADDYAGQKYSDVTSKLADASLPASSQRVPATP
jgi:hypothetical protein